MFSQVWVCPRVEGGVGRGRYTPGQERGTCPLPPPWTRQGTPPSPPLPSPPPFPCTGQGYPSLPSSFPLHRTGVPLPPSPISPDKTGVPLPPMYRLCSRQYASCSHAGGLWPGPIGGGCLRWGTPPQGVPPPTGWTWLGYPPPPGVDWQTKWNYYLLSRTTYAVGNDLTFARMRLSQQIPHTRSSGIACNEKLQLLFIRPQK